MAQRCFNENPEFKEVDGRLRPMYGTTDPLTMDFSDLMNAYYQLKDMKSWSQLFARFKEFWQLDIPNPWTSDDLMITFMSDMEANDSGETDVYSKDDIEKQWNLSYIYANPL